MPLEIKNACRHIQPACEERSPKYLCIPLSHPDEVFKKAIYQEIRPETMASLSELLQKDISVQDLMFALLTELKALSTHLYSAGLSIDEEMEFEKNLVRMAERNAKVFG